MCQKEFKAKKRIMFQCWTKDTTAIPFYIPSQYNILWYK